MHKESDLISVGEIVNTHGHKGESRVWLLTDYPERFKINEVFWMEKDGSLSNLTIESVRPHKNFLVIKFKEILDMNAAEEIKGGILKISRDQLIKLPNDTCFIFEIIGMEVYTESGHLLGKIKDVIQTGSNDVYIVAGESKDYLIPALKKVIMNIDKEERRITIKPLDGLLEL